jgi:hypothetical protein
MPRDNMVRVEVAIYVAPELLPHFEKAAEREHDNCLMLDIERTVGVHIDNEQQSEELGYERRVDLFPRHTALPDTYGAERVEVEYEGRS